MKTRWLWLACLAVCTIAPLGASMAQNVTITVDLQHRIGANRPAYAWFGYDEANYTTMRNGAALLRELHSLAPVPVRIRTHHLLSTGDGIAALKWSSTNVYSEDAAGKPVYDFRIFDSIFDEYHRAGVVPMVELGFTPQALASGTGEYQDRYPDFSTGGAVHNPPKDYEKWQAMIRTIVDHLVKRYGRQTVADWYFEVWNEPDISYWHGTPEEYFELYDRTVAGVRAALPEAKVGGPATTGPGEANAAKFLEAFLEHVAARKVPLDFISFHAKGQPSFRDGRVIMGLSHELNDADKGFAIIARHSRFQNLPVILSEADPEGCAACSMKVNRANAYRNGTLYPAYTAAAYKGLLDLAVRHHIDLIGMVSWSFEFENREFFEGFRSLSTNGIDKPVLNFFRMAALLRANRMATSNTAEITTDDIIAHGVRGAPDIDALATADSRHAAVMLWNYHDEQQTAPATPVTLTIQNLPPALTRVRLTHYRIDGKHSNAYTVWQAMGSPQNPTPEQFAKIKAKQGLELIEAPRRLAVSAGETTITVEMPRQSISLVQLEW